MRSHCPINFWLEHLGDRWSLLILRDLLFKGKSAFKDFMAGGEEIATNVLTERLKRLEKAGIVIRHGGKRSRREIYYSVTEKGKDLIPALVEIIVWSEKYDSKTAAERGFVVQAKTNRDKLIADIRLQVERGIDESQKA